MDDRGWRVVMMLIEGVLRRVETWARWWVLMRMDDLFRSYRTSDRYEGSVRLGSSPRDPKVMDRLSNRKRLKVLISGSAVE